MSSSRILLDDLVEPYLESRSVHLVKSTLTQERRYLERFLARLKDEGVIEARDVTEVHVGRFYNVLSTSPSPRGGYLSSSCLQQALLCVRGFLVWARGRGLLLHDFSGLAIPKRDDESPSVPTADEMKRLLKLPKRSNPTGLRDRLLLELLYVLGLRVGECVQLELHSANLGAETLTVIGKGGHERLLPLSPSVRASLLDYLANGRPLLAPRSTEGALFVSGVTKQRLGGQSMRLCVKHYSAQIGLKLGPHQLRHACATHLVEGGAELAHIAAFLGHQRLETTQRYTRVLPLELAREHRRCHPRAFF